MMGLWALRPDVFDALEASAHLTPSAEQLAALGRGNPSPLTRAGSTAEIAVRGILTEQPDVLAAIFGGGNVTYPSIRQALAEAEADASVRDIVFVVDSPGGSVAGLFETLDALEAAKKPRRVKASLAASAAFALAAVAGPIEAVGPASTFGSIGIVATMRVNDGVISITSTEAPNKRPDPKTESGKAAIRAELDQVHDLFVAAIARGRGTSAAKVNADFGRGAVYLTAKARAAGMIDSGRTARGASAELGEPGSQLAMAQALEAQLGSATARGENETQAAYARRLLAAVEPPKPKKVERSAADLVADMVCGVKHEPSVDEPATAASRAADAVADVVIAAMKKEKGNL
jgi:ClpP class serine protease